MGTWRVLGAAEEQQKGNLVSEVSVGRVSADEVGETGKDQTTEDLVGCGLHFLCEWKMLEGPEQRNDSLFSQFTRCCVKNGM